MSSMRLDGSDTMPNSNCSETYAVLRVVGKDVDPIVLTGAIGLQPFICVRVGDVRPTGTRPRSEGVWSHTTQGVVDSTDLADHLQWLVERLKLDVRKLLPIDCRFEVQCVWRSATGHGGPTLPAPLLSELSARGLDLDFDIYFDE
jgi:Domain of unknown function (DUF4279)